MDTEITRAKMLLKDLEIDELEDFQKLISDLIEKKKSQKHLENVLDKRLVRYWW